jgi:hypothetical protein
VSVDHSLRQAHEANRSESARLVRAVGREEERARLVADAKWARKLDALQMTSGRTAWDWGEGFVD